MKEKMIAMLIGMMVKRMDTDTFKMFADKLLDMAEDFVAQSPSKYDDAIVLPLCLTIRAAFSIEDNDE